MIRYPLESLLQWVRFITVKRWIPTGGVLVDIGCGNDSLVLKQLCSSMDFCVGIDEEVSSHLKGNIQYIQSRLKKKISIESELAHVVVMLASLEHMKYPQAIVQEVFRILKPAGTCLVTVPSRLAKPVLNVMAYCRLVNPKMIHQHQVYYSQKQLHTLFQNAGFRQVQISFSFFGLHLVARVIK